MSPAINQYFTGAREPAPVTTASHSCECAPACPDCGGLSCVCRPRFFAGQLLTEIELNGVMEYIRDRNRQQNRLLGHGVVCGLEVACDPCGGGSVTVTPGHAISPCGEDIVVCSPASVPVCDLINACREREQHERDCAPYGPSNSECVEREETWILYISYAEQVSRPMTALRASSGNSGSRCSCGGQSTSKGSGCSCGSGSSSGCGCGGSKSSSSAGCGCGGAKSNSARVGDRCAPPATCSSSRQSRPYQPACEPTVVCETFSFSMTKVVTNYRDDSKPGRGVASAFARCRSDLDRSLPKKPVGAFSADRAAWNRWCCAVHDALPDILSRHAVHDCSLLERLRLVPCPAVNDPNFDALMGRAESSFDAIVADLLRSCLCSLLLPPCPEPVDDDRVALATLTIRRDPCSVKSICNWDVRSIVLTPQAIMHWLGLTSVPELIRNVVERLCCAPAQREVLPPAGVKAVDFAKPVPFATSLASAMSANTASRLAMPRLVDSLFAAEPKLTKQQLDDPTEYVLTHDVIAPLMRGAGTSWNEGLSRKARPAPPKDDNG